jgi:hypothetical protein
MEVPVLGSLELRLTLFWPIYLELFANVFILSGRIVSRSDAANIASLRETHYQQVVTCYIYLESQQIIHYIDCTGEELTFRLTGDAFSLLVLCSLTKTIKPQLDEKH